MKPEELEKRFTDPRRGQAFRERLMSRVLLVLLRYAQKRTPVRFGTLRRSETTRTEAKATRGFLGTNVFYAPFVHKRVPFFQQAIDDGRAQVDRVVQQAGDEYLAGIAE